MDNAIFNFVWQLYIPYNNSNNTWATNVRDFITFQSELIDEIDDTDYHTYDSVVNNIFHMFVDKLDIDEDDFDGPNDLHPTEWETFDMIVIHYAKTIL